MSVELYVVWYFQGLYGKYKMKLPLFSSNVQNPLTVYEDFKNLRIMFKWK